MNHKKHNFIYLLLAVVIGISACSTGSLVPDATVTPLLAATSIPFTAAPQPTETPIPTPTLGIGSTIIGQDSAPLVYIPEGEFLMGSTYADTFAQEDEFPQHTVYLDAFWIDQYEVTNQQYAKCVEASVCNPPIKTNSAKRESYYGNPEFDEYPVIEMRWEDANTYCTWAGRSLPTEAQWEKAARGTDSRIFPWGNENPNETLLNYNKNVGDTTKGGTYEGDKSPYGVYDMVGNVMEWTHDRYSQIYYSNPNPPLKTPWVPMLGKLMHYVVGRFIVVATLLFV